MKRTIIFSLAIIFIVVFTIAFAFIFRTLLNKKVTTILESPSPMEYPTSVMTTLTATSTTTSMLPESAKTSMRVITTTTASGRSLLTVNIIPEKHYVKDTVSMRLYKGDTGVMRVMDSGGVKLSNVEVSLNGETVGFTNNDGLLALEDLSSGDHIITAVKSGFQLNSVNISVWKSSYGSSIFIRRKLSDSQRREYISDGRVNVRLYDLPSCAICRVMRPRVSGIVSDRRDCIVYEIVSLWKYNKELAGRFPGMQTPIIEVEGTAKSFQTSGMVSVTKMLDMIEQASPECFIGG